MTAPSISSVITPGDVIVASTDETFAVWVKNTEGEELVLYSFDNEADAITHLDTLGTGINFAVPNEAGVTKVSKSVTLTSIATRTFKGE